VIIIDFRFFSRTVREWNTLPEHIVSLTTILKHSKMPLLLSEVVHWVLHCIVQCRELRGLRPYPEEPDNNWFYPASAPALSFHQVCTCFCLISCEPIVAATVLSTLAHAPDSGVFTWLKLRALLPRKRRGPGGQLTPTFSSTRPSCPHFFEYAVHMRRLTPHFLSAIPSLTPLFVTLRGLCIRRYSYSATCIILFKITDRFFRYASPRLCNPFIFSSTSFWYQFLLFWHIYSFTHHLFLF